MFPSFASATKLQIRFGFPSHGVINLFATRGDPVDTDTRTPAQKAMDKELGRAVILASHDRYAEAMTVLERAIQAYGDTPDPRLCGAYRDLAEAAAMIGQTDKGLATARKAHDMLARIGVGAEHHPITVQREAARTYSILALNHFLRGERQETYEALEQCRLAGFFYCPGETYQWGSMVYTPTVLSAIGDCGVDVERAVAEAGRSRMRTYPDGSIQIDGPGARQFHTGAFGFLPFMERVLRGGDEFELNARRRLFPLVVPEAFGDRHCTINAWSDWVAKYGKEDSFYVRPWPFADSAKVDRQRAPVTIVFKRRLSQEVRTKFLNMLVEWANTVCSEGLFGEGPIKFAEPTVTFLTRAAQFSIDISASGPHTLVWFILSLLAFCPVAIIIEVRFACLSEEWLKHLGTSVPLPLRKG